RRLLFRRPSRPPMGSLVIVAIITTGVGAIVDSLAVAVPIGIPAAIAVADLLHHRSVAFGDRTERADGGGRSRKGTEHGAGSDNTDSCQFNRRHHYPPFA